MKKTLIFVDGQNLFYALKNMRLFEREINWDKFFNHLLVTDDELIRVYWYQAQKLSQPVLSLDRARRIAEEEAKKIVTGAPPPALPTKEEILRDAHVLLEQAGIWHEQQSKRYEAQLHRYDELAIKYPLIEMVRRGIVKIDPFKQLYLGEKGIDIALAVHMIKFHEKCDKLILVSGDLDYAEAIQFIKDNLKTVHIVRLFSGHPPVNRNVSRTLMVLADKVIDVYETEIKDQFLI